MIVDDAYRLGIGSRRMVSVATAEKISSQFCVKILKRLTIFSAMGIFFLVTSQQRFTFRIQLLKTSQNTAFHTFQLANFNLFQQRIQNLCKNRTLPAAKFVKKKNKNMVSPCSQHCSFTHSTETNWQFSAGLHNLRTFSHNLLHALRAASKGYSWPRVPSSKGVLGKDAISVFPGVENRCPNIWTQHPIKQKREIDSLRLHSVVP